MSPELLLGSSIAVFAGFTLPVMCAAAALIGMRVARRWQPARKLLPYGIALALAARGLSVLLFGADPLSVSGFAIDAYCVLMVAGLGYHYTLSRQLARQYPWMYRRFLVFSWRRVRDAASSQAPAATG